VDNEEILALFSNTRWDDIDKESVYSATKACKQIVGAFPDAGWIDRSEKIGYWFVAGRDDLVHVTGGIDNWMVSLQRPKWASTEAVLLGAPNAPSFALTLTLKSTHGDEIKMKGSGHSAHGLLAFFQGHLSKIGS
jgi:hypothetical protein